MCVFILAAVLFATVPALAQVETGAEVGNRQVGLGLVAGAAFPFANQEKYKITESWGFYVDIPIISTFHISPATTLYRLNSDNVGNNGITDLSLNFKFVIPLKMWHIYVAALMGISNGKFINDDFIQMHVGGNLGFAYRVISNIDITAMCQYKLIIDGDQGNVNMMQAMGGMQFNF
jgi:hypothetical protein